jgi:hypothetical protein
VTATQGGTTADQRAALLALLVGIQPSEVHHGDCIGGDTDIHHLTREHLAARVIIHPPDNPIKRAFCGGDEARKPLPYLLRNQAIVAESDRLIAAPGGPERARSGTWYTVRHALAQGRRVTIVWPDGSVEERPSAAGSAS